MKSAVVLILGCLPLTVLTAQSLMELAGCSELPDFGVPGTGSKPAAEQVAKARERLAVAKPVAEALVAADLYSGKPASILQSIPVDSPWRKLCESWMDWTRSAEVIRGTIAAERDAASGKATEIGKAVEQLDRLVKRFAGVPPRGTGPILKWAVDKTGDLRTKIDRQQALSKVGALLDRAKASFQEGNFLVCISQCDNLLSPAPEGAIDAAVVVQVRLLKRRAEFGRDLDRLHGALRRTDTEKAKVALMAELVAKYSKEPPSDRAQVQQLDEVRSRIREIEDREQAVRMDRESTAALADLEKNLPAALADRFHRAAKIASEYPSEQVRVRLQTLVRRWLADGLPEKQLQESPALQEAETTAGEIVRGFFRTINDPAGRPTGYQRYETAEQMRHPTAVVGTFPKDSFAAPPHASMPRQCVERYRQARTAVLASPHKKDVWNQLTSLCRELDRLLAIYRSKPNASREPLSFNTEGRFAETTAEIAGSLRKLFEP